MDKLWLAQESKSRSTLGLRSGITSRFTTITHANVEGLPAIQWNYGEVEYTYLVQPILMYPTRKVMFHVITISFSNLWSMQQSLHRIAHDQFASSPKDVPKTPGYRRNTWVLITWWDTHWGLVNHTVPVISLYCKIILSVHYPRQHCFCHNSHMQTQASW